MQIKYYSLLFAGILLSSATLLLVGSWLCYTSTIDTATVGLMSVNILHGDRPLFFYGQAYFGAIESYLAAFYIYIFGFSEFVVSLAPISFTIGWIILTYLLFTRLHNKTTGIVAAASTAFPGYYVFWYSIGTYGYSVIACAGTAILWLSLRMLQRNDRNSTLIMQGAVLGGIAGIAIWTHPLTFPFLVIAAGILAIFAFRERLRSDILLTIVLAASIGSLGFLPFYYETGSFFNEFSNRAQLSWATLYDALSTLVFTNLAELIIWNFRHVFPGKSIQYLIEYGGVAILFAGAILSVYSLISSRSNAFKFRLFLIPLFYCVVFLMMYLQHQMATLSSPRYVICLYSVMLCIVWSIAVSGQSTRTLKTISTILFCSWLAFQITGSIFFITNNREYARIERKEIRQIVDAAYSKNLKSIVTYGSEAIGYKAQKLSMFAENKIVFAHADLERYQSNAQFTEIDMQKGYLTNAAFKVPLESNLEKLGASYTVDQIGKYFLFSDLRLKPLYSMRAINSDQIQIRHSPEKNSWEPMGQLGDLNQDDGRAMTPFSGESITFDLKRKRTICGLWMFAPQNRHTTRCKGFGQYEVYVSHDDVIYNKIFKSQIHPANVFHSGPQIFIGGSLCKGEILFDPVSIRYIKIQFIQESVLPITEMLIFETDGSLRQRDTDDIDAIVQQVKKQDLDFVLGDRWISANLLEEFKGSEKAEIALQRHGTKLNYKPLLYVIKPEKGQALLCDAAVADGCEELLLREYGQVAIRKRVDFHNYSLFSFTGQKILRHSKTRAALLWNGHIPLRTKELLLTIKTKGVYPDSWTNGKGFYYDFDYEIDHKQHSVVVIHTYGWRPDKDINRLKVRLSANNNTILPFQEIEKNAYRFSIPASLDKIDSLTIETTTFVPSSQDNRNLGVDVKSIEIR
ncbi:glycosyltransferase family 39 protein [Desulfocapsa sp. AH-315-G09]|nr:glycosyltransferase family 39 protein [Desulfocapsa sp. AH-315-G09]